MYHTNLIKITSLKNNLFLVFVFNVYNLSNKIIFIKKLISKSQSQKKLQYLIKKISNNKIVNFNTNMIKQKYSKIYEKCLQNPGIIQ